MRAKSIATLSALGFVVAPGLPTRAQRKLVGSTIRPARDIALRLMALDAVFTWVAFPEANAPSESITGYILANQLERWMTGDDLLLIRGNRSSEDAPLPDVGWRLENMWPLAWILGYQRAPQIGGQQGADVTDELFDWLPGLDDTADNLLETCSLRSDNEVVGLEDLFYCAHNAVRSAQLGRPTVPPGFHPNRDGEAIYERRLSLSWALSPGVDWDETDIST